MKSDMREEEARAVRLIMETKEYAQAKGEVIDRVLKAVGPTAARMNPDELDDCIKDKILTSIHGSYHLAHPASSEILMSVATALSHNLSSIRLDVRHTWLEEQKLWGSKA